MKGYEDGENRKKHCKFLGYEPNTSQKKSFHKGIHWYRPRDGTLDLEKLKYDCQKHSDTKKYDLANMLRIVGEASAPG